MATNTVTVPVAADGFYLPSSSVLTPNEPPAGGWGEQSTFDDIFGGPPVVPPGVDTVPALVSWLSTLPPARRAQWASSPRTAGQIRALNEAGYSIDVSGNMATPAAPPPPPPPIQPQRPGTVPGSVWNNPESEAPRGYNPELWAQREIGPNRTYQGGVTGMGVGGPTNADGTAMYAAPAEIKPTREVDPFGYEPANLFQRQKFEGQFSGGPDVLSNAQGDSFERNLLSSIAEAINSTDPAVSERAKFIMAAASNPAVLRDMPFRRNGPASLIDRAGYQYDMQNGGDRRRQSQSTDTGKDSMDREKKNPFMPRLAKGTMERRSPMRMPIIDYQDHLNSSYPIYPSTFAWSIDKGIDPWNVKNQRQGMRETGMLRPEKRYPNGTIGMNPFMPSFAEPTRNMPVYTRPFEPGPIPDYTERRVPQRTPIPSGLVAAQPPIRPRPFVWQPYMSTPTIASRNPFLSGGASRGSRNPFR